MKLLNGTDYYDYHNLNLIELINSLNLLNHLVYFEFDLSILGKKPPDQSEIINDFKSLRYLILYYNKFTKKFELKLNHLRQ